MSSSTDPCIDSNVKVVGKEKNIENKLSKSARKNGGSGSGGSDKSVGLKRGRKELDITFVEDLKPKLKNKDLMGEEQMQMASNLRAELQEIEQRILQYKIKHEKCEKMKKKHIDLLHNYNEIKDVVQLLLGRLSEMQGTTTRELHERFGLDANEQ